MKVLLVTTQTPDDRKTLCCARTLGRAGVRVAVGSDGFHGEACWSRFVERRLRCPHPREGEAAFVAAVGEHVERHLFDVVLPTNDYTTLALARRREALSPRAATALPPTDSLEVARDKARTAALARRLGIETPVTWEVDCEADLERIAERIDYPCVLKLRSGSGAVGLWMPASPAELRAAYRAPRPASDMAFDRDRLLVQEYVSGDTCDVCALCRHGELRAVSVQRRIRTYPEAAGAGTLNETIRRPELVERAARLLAELRWHGPAAVEFKVARDDDRVRLIEINGRFWGVLDLAVQAGIDYPLLTCRLALDGDCGTALDYEVGLRYRSPFPFGLLAALGGRARWSAARDFFAPRRRMRSDLDWSDPLPHLAEALYICRRAWKRRGLGPERRRL